MVILIYYHVNLRLPLYQQTATSLSIQLIFQPLRLYILGATTLRVNTHKIESNWQVKT